MKALSPIPPLPLHTQPISIWRSSSLNCFQYWTFILKEDSNVYSNWHSPKPSSCPIHLCNPGAFHTSDTTEVLNKYLLMKINKYLIHFPIPVFTGETLVQLLLHCADHLPIISATPLTANPQLVYVARNKPSISPPHCTSSVQPMLYPRLSQPEG